MDFQQSFFTLLSGRTDEANLQCKGSKVAPDNALLVKMNITINISDATLTVLREQARQTGKPLDSVVEATLLRGLALANRAERPVKLKTYAVGIRPKYRDLSSNQLYDQLESEDFHQNVNK